jgi:hypothetical protein
VGWTRATAIDTDVRASSPVRKSVKKADHLRIIAAVSYLTTRANMAGRYGAAERRVDMAGQNGGSKCKKPCLIIKQGFSLST